MTAPTFEDGAWYWVEKEGWIGDPPTIAPALYKAQSDAWYSFAFSGIPTREVKVLEACRRAPAVPKGWKITEEMHMAAVKVLRRASGVDDLPQRMFDAMLAAAPQQPEAAAEIGKAQQ